MPYTKGLPFIATVAPVAPVSFRAATTGPGALPMIKAVTEVFGVIGQAQTDDVMEVQAVAGHPLIPERMQVPAKWNYIINTSMQTVADGDFYIAYRPFCRTCRYISHPTASCPQRAARHHQPPTFNHQPTPLPMPPMQPWSFPPSHLFTGMPPPPPPGGAGPSSYAPPLYGQPGTPGKRSRPDSNA